MIEYSLRTPCCGECPKFMLLDQAMVTHFSSCEGGLPEAPFIDWAWRDTNKPGMLIDVGAHVGSWTLPFAAAGAKVVAFEPHSTIRALLSRAVRANGLSNQVTVLPSALGEKAGLARLTCGAVDGGMASLIQQVPGPVDETVVVESLDSYLERVEWVPKVLKIDVEGSELDVLRGARRTITQHKPVLFFECWYDERGQRIDELFPYVEELGYHPEKTWWPEMWIARPCR